MRRRDFIAGVGAFGSLAAKFAHADTPTGTLKRPIIGILVLTESQNDNSLVKELVDSLAGLGYVDGKTATIIARYAGGNPQTLQKLAAELAGFKPDVIAADSASPIKAVIHAAPDVPVVGIVMSAPVEQGLVASFAHPGRNVTGMVSSEAEGEDGKLFDIALRAVPSAKSIGFLANPSGGLEIIDRQAYHIAAGQRRIAFEIAEATTSANIEPAIEALVGAGAEIIIAETNGMFYQERSHIGAVALANHVPVVSLQSVVSAEAGYLLTYGVDAGANYRRAAVFIDKILKGAKPGDLPVEFPPWLYMTINLKTANLLGLQIPQELLNIADQVIE